MNADYLAKFYEACGHKVIRTESGYWYSASPRIYHSLPPTETRDPSYAELQTLFREHRLLGVQFPNFRPSGMQSGRFVVRNKDYDLHSLQRQFRQHVRKGLNQCEIRNIDFDQLHRVGMHVNGDAMSRREYQIPHFVAPRLWRRFCDAGQATPGSGVMASFVKGELAAYLVYFIAGDTSYGLHMLSRSDMRAYRPNHLLYFAFTKAMMSREDVKSVSTGIQSMPTPRDIDQFKRHAGYQKEICYISVALRPMAKLLLQNRATILALDTITQIVGNNHHLQRIRLTVTMANLTEPRRS